MGSAAGTASVAAHGDGLLVVLDVLEELDSTLELPAVDGLGSLAGVLEGDAEVGTAGAGRLGGQNLGRSVSDLINATKSIRSAHHERLLTIVPPFVYAGVGSSRVVGEKSRENER